MRYNLLPLLATTLLLLTGNTFASGTVEDGLLQQLINEVRGLTSRLEQLEQSMHSLRVENAVLKEAADTLSDATSTLSKTGDRLAWAENIRLKGDFRYRYENIDEQNKSKQRNRSRARARIEAVAHINDDLKVGLGLASGGDDPVSTNQTLGAGGSSKGINLDLAYFSWTGPGNSQVLGGKFRNPFYKPAKSSLIWDGDYRPEGFAVKYAQGAIFANAAFLYLESDDKAGSKDAESYWGLQLGYTADLLDATRLVAGISYYDIPVQGSQPFFDADDSFGNSLAMDGSYQNNYRELEIFAEINTQIADLPLSVFLDWVENQAADELETGLAVGFKLGKASASGTWQAAYTYQDLEADAVLGLTTDSDFGGGGTGNRGHIIKGAYAFNRNTALSLTYFINESNSQDINYDRLQVDLKFKY
ncbi:MAG: putative porin [Pseudomonadales bacterium]|nr:putative porin [Pseudomonadales bacterium]